MILPNVSSLHEWNPYDDRKQSRNNHNESLPSIKLNSSLLLDDISNSYTDSSPLLMTKSRRRVNIKLNKLLLKDKTFDYLTPLKEERAQSLEYVNKTANM